MNLKKVGALLLAGAMAVSVVGCGGSGDEKKEDKKGKTEGIGKVGDELIKDVKLSVYVPQGKNENFIKKAAELYNESTGANIELEITNITPGSATTQQLSPKLVSGEQLPDIIFIQDMSVAGLLEQFPDGFASATDYGFYEEYGDQFLDAKVDTLNQVSGGEAVGFPMDWGSVVAYYQIEAFEKAGIKYEDIKSWDELIEAGKVIKEKTGMNLMTLNETGEVELLLVLMEQQGVSLLDEEGNINLATPEAKKGMEIIQRLIDEDLITFYAGDNQEAMYQEVALFMTGGWYASNMEANFPDAKGKWCVSKVVPFSEEDPGYNPISGGSSWYIGGNAKNGAAAAQFLTYAMTDEKALEAAIELSVVSSNKNAYQSEAANKEFEFYNNQKLNLIFNEANEASKGTNLFSTIGDARAYAAAATYDAWNSGDSDKALEKAAEDFAAKHNVKVNK